MIPSMFGSKDQWRPIAQEGIADLNAVQYILQNPGLEGVGFFYNTERECYLGLIMIIVSLGFFAK
jgi:hypothetical protein